MDTRQDTLLRRALLGNALFSTTCSLVLLVAAAWLEPVLGAPALALRIIGAALLPFAFGLFSNARRPDLRRTEAWLAVALDLGWVAASAALLLGDLWPLEPGGRWAVIGVGGVVLLFAALQTWGLLGSAQRTVAVG